MESEKCLDLKRVTFFPDKIVIKGRKRNVVLNIDDIEFIEYTRMSVLAFLVCLTPGRFLILLNKKVGGSKTYCLFIGRYKTVLQIQEILNKDIYIAY